VPPPAGLAAWWPFDETAGNVAADISGNVNLGRYQNSPFPTAGNVAGALAFNGVDSFLRVSHSPSIALASGTFTIDFWIFPAVGEVGGPIFRKGVQGPNPIAISGPGVNLYYQSGGFVEVLDQSATNLFSPTDQVPPGVWTFVAVTVDLVVTQTTKFYVNGLLVKTLPLRIPTGIRLANTEPIVIGGAEPRTPGTFGTAQDWSFEGSLDELELFDRALSNQEIQSIFLAGRIGKCKEDCHSARAAACASPGSGLVDMTICNNSTAQHSYSWSFASLAAASSLCNLDGPASFNPAAGTAPVPSGSCVTLPVGIQCPADKPQEGHGCFELQVENLDTKATTTCGGSYVLTNRWRWTPHQLLYEVPQDPAFNSAVFDVTNMGPGAETLNYTLTALPTSMSSPNNLVSVAGRSSGTVSGSISLGEGQTGLVVAPVSLAVHRPFEFQDLVVSADLDGDGKASEISSTGLHSQLDCNHNGVDDSIDLARGIGQDCNGNAIPDSCEIAARPFLDCNRNGILDSCEVVAGTVPDVNHNGRPDSCDFSSVQFQFSGTAQGGTVSVTVQGFSSTCTVTITTMAGQSASTVAANLTAALNSDPCVIAQGTTAEARGNFFIVRGFTLSDSSVSTVITDPGLQEMKLIPTLSTVGLLIFAAVLCTAALAIFRRRRAGRRPTA
jgi:hypothetical protein